MYIETAKPWCDGAIIPVVLRLIRLVFLLLLLKQSQGDILTTVLLTSSFFSIDYYSIKITNVISQ